MRASINRVRERSGTGEMPSSFELSADAEGHGRTYQQGTGTQVNVEKAYFGSVDLATQWVARSQTWPLPSEADPIKLGVHKARPDAQRSEPSYLMRDSHQQVSSELTEAAAKGGLVLIVGDSTAGKSRLAFECLKATLPDHVIFVPESGTELRSSATALPGVEAPVVIWLDDLDRYLGPDGLSPGVLSIFQASRIVLLATMRAEFYVQRRDSPPRTDG